MEWVVERDGGALQRIVALLFELAQFADQAGSIPFPVRAIVLAVLRHAEFAAWAFAFGTASGPTAGARNERPHHVTPRATLVAGHHGPAEAARLAVRFRALALFIANCAIRAFPSTAMPSTVRRAISAKRTCSSGSWRGPTALPAPDTS